MRTYVCVCLCGSADVNALVRVCVSVGKCESCPLKQVVVLLPQV